MDQIYWEIYYYLRQHLWRTVQTICNEELRKGQDGVLLFWKSFAVFKEGGINEAIRELT